jgi:ABC-type multidrug transport system ATPase subunit
LRHFAVAKSDHLPRQARDKHREISKEMRFSQQHDILYDGLSAIEHLELFGTIVGLNDEEVAEVRKTHLSRHLTPMLKMTILLRQARDKHREIPKEMRLSQEASRLLAAVCLTAKAFDLAKQMSGGQRRRLSLAASLIGRPAVAFLDEPT